MVLNLNSLKLALTRDQVEVLGVVVSTSTERSAGRSLGGVTVYLFWPV